MSDVIVVMRDGRIQQQGGPTELYERPVNRFVADFIGSSNFLPAIVEVAGSGTATSSCGPPTASSSAAGSPTPTPTGRRRQRHRGHPAGAHGGRTGGGGRSAVARGDAGRGSHPAGHLSGRPDRVPGADRAGGRVDRPPSERGGRRGRPGGRSGRPCDRPLARGGQPRPCGMRSATGRAGYGRARRRSRRGGAGSGRVPGEDAARPRSVAAASWRRAGCSAPARPWPPALASSTSARPPQRVRPHRRPPAAAPSAAASAAAELRDSRRSSYTYNWSEYVSQEEQGGVHGANGRRLFGGHLREQRGTAREAAGGGGNPGYDICCPTAEYVPGMIEAGYLAEARHVPDPELPVHQPDLQEHGMGPQQRVHRPQGLRHDRDHVPDEARLRARDLVARVLRPHQGQVFGQGRRSSTRWATCSRSRSRCSATRSTTTIRPTSRRPATSCSSSPRTSSRSTPTTTTTSWRPRRRSLALGWTGGRSDGPAGQPRYGGRGLHRTRARAGLYWMDVWSCWRTPRNPTPRTHG